MGGVWSQQRLLALTWLCCYPLSKAQWLVGRCADDRKGCEGNGVMQCAPPLHNNTKKPLSRTEMRFGTNRSQTHAPRCSRAWRFAEAPGEVCVCMWKGGARQGRHPRASKCEGEVTG